MEIKHIIAIPKRILQRLQQLLIQKFIRSEALRNLCPSEAVKDH